MQKSDIEIVSFFKSLYRDDPEGLQRYLDDVFGLIHEEAVKRNIEFDGYFQSKWEESANTIINFDEEYFSNLDRRNLYVYKAAEIDPHILNILQKAYLVALLKMPVIKDIHREIYLLEEKGISF